MESKKKKKKKKEVPEPNQSQRGTVKTPQRDSATQIPQIEKNSGIRKCVAGNN